VEPCCSRWRPVPRQRQQGQHLHAPEARQQIAKLDQEIETYGKSLDANDAAEAKQRADGSGDGNKADGGDVGDKMKS